MAHWSSIMSHEKWQLHLRNDGSLIRTDHYFLDGYPRSEARMCHTRSLMQLSVRVMYRIRSISDCHSTCQLMMSSGENHCYDVMWKGNISMRTFLFLYMLRSLGDRGYQEWTLISDEWGVDTWPDMTTCYWYDWRHEAAPGVHNGLIARWRHTEPQSGTTSMNIEGIRYINILFIDKFIPFIEVRWSKLIVEKIFISKKRV